MPEFGPPIGRKLHIPSVPEVAFEQLLKAMEDFQSNLSAEMEVGIVANGAGLILHVETVGRKGHMVAFNGTDSEGRVSALIQHYTQVNVQMVAVPKLDASARRIGF